MIYDVLLFLKRKLESGLSGGRASAEPLVHLSQPWSDNDSNQNATFLNAISLINVEEEKIFKSQTPGIVNKGNGQYYKKAPELRLNLYMMISAYHKNYEDGLRFISRVIGFFQANCVFQEGLPENINKILIDLHTVGFDQQNQIWASMGTGYIPSVIYKIRTIVIDTAPLGEEMKPIVEIKTSM